MNRLLRPDGAGQAQPLSPSPAASSGLWFRGMEETGRLAQAQFSLLSHREPVAVVTSTRLDSPRACAWAGWFLLRQG
jgi:hypothetical protein